MLILTSAATLEQKSSAELDTNGRAWEEFVLLMLGLFFLLLSSSYHHLPPPRSRRQSSYWKRRVATVSNGKPVGTRGSVVVAGNRAAWHGATDAVEEDDHGRGCML